jgi:5-methylcytosine-specific restriction endonuclease McrA
MDPLTVNVCTHCGVVKPATEYYRNPSTRNRLDRICKQCRKAATRQWKAANRERARKTDRQWRARNRDRSNAHTRKWRAQNKEKHLELCRRWNAENRDRCRVNLALWKEQNPGRLAEWHRQRWAKLRAGAQYSPAEWRALLALFGHRCVACNVEARSTPEGFLTPDHIVPVCMSGPNTIDNIQPLCLDCNRRKNGRVIDYRPDWAR